jgi:hypothetical protein
MTLYKNCIERNSSECLYITCQYLLNNNTDTLESEWINISSNIGKSKNLVFGKLWCNVNSDLLKLLNSDQYNVQDALLMTSKLYLLNSRINNNENLVNNIKKIRNEIIDFFPDTAALAYDGIKLYRQILPQPNSEHFIFYSRILASFSRLFDAFINKDEKGKDNDIRNALEYISRKKNDMPLPGTWPLDTLNNKNYSHGDPVWFLWGMMLSYFNDSKIATNFDIYCWNFKKTNKLDRIGLLWGLSYSLKNNLNFNWTPEELNILDQVVNMSSELWQNVKETHQEESKDKQTVQIEQKQKFVLDNFMPRSSYYDSENNPKFKSDKSSKNKNIPKSFIL